MDPYLDKLFASPNDFDLINGLFSRISYECDGEDVDELRKLPEPQRVVLQIWGASGIIGNGGFQYLFESGLADFSGIADAYDTIKSSRAAKAVRAAVSLFPNSRPQANVDARLKYLDKLGVRAGQKLEECSNEIFDTARQSQRLLAVYVRANKAAFTNLKPRRGEDLKDFEGKELPPPPTDSDADTVIRWLTSIGAKVHRWSDLKDYPVAETLVKPTSGDPIYWIELDENRATTDAEIAAMLKYEIVKDVQDLDLKETYVTIDGLRRLKELPKLDKLSLRTTDIVDDWLPALSELKVLTKLDLSSTQISDQGLASLVGIPNLQELVLSRTKVQGPGLVALKNARHLTSLGLFECPVTDAGLTGLAQLVQLKALDLRETTIGDAALKTVGELTELTHLSLTSTRITDEGLLHLSGLQKLESLELEVTRIDGRGLAGWGKLQKLRNLNLYDTDINDAGVKHLAAITSLTELSLSFTQVTDAAIEHLAKLVNLKSLDLSGTKVRGRPALRQLEQLKSLEKLSLPDGLEGNANVEHLRRQLPKAKISN